MPRATLHATKKKKDNIATDSAERDCDSVLSLGKIKSTFKINEDANEKNIK